MIKKWKINEQFPKDHLICIIYNTLFFDANFQYQIQVYAIKHAFTKLEWKPSTWLILN